MQQRLPSIRQLHFSSRSGPGSQCGWSGSGHGVVDVACHEDGSLTFTEAGHFQLAAPNTVTPRPVPFRNVYRWRVSSNHVALYHERRGQQAAVWLFDLVAAAEQDAADLISSQAHLCVDDLYQARLIFTDGGFDLEWMITGPKKDEHLYYRYRSVCE